MTKNLKRIISAVMAFVMVMAMGSFAAFAEPNTYELKINETDTKNSHTYYAYQIFSGTYSHTETPSEEEGATTITDRTLSDLEWGSGVMATDSASTITLSVEDAVAKIQELYSADNNNWGAEFEKYLNTNGISLNKANATLLNSGNNYTATVNEGYYLIKDESENTGTDEDFAFTSYLVSVVGDREITPKKDVPEVQKKVQDVNDSEADSTTGWQDSADYDIGDYVPFQLKGTLPDNYADYDKYKYVFHDTMSDGLTLVNDTDHPIKVVYYADEAAYVADKDGTKGTELTDYTISSSFDGIGTNSIADRRGFDIEFDNIKTNTAVTKDSIIVVTYYAQLNTNAKIGSEGNDNTVYLEFSNNPNLDGSGTTGRTPDDKVTVFTFNLLINKIDGDNALLEGAKFELTKYDADKGEYVALNSDVIVSTQDKSNSSPAEDGKAVRFTFTGLDAGIYRLEETATPEGYNSIKPIIITVKADSHDTASDDPQLGELSVEATYEDGSQFGGTFTINADATVTEASASDENQDPRANVYTNIQNLKGSTLPETGGMGTKIFYTLGGIFAVGAGVLLVARRRMKRA